MKPANELMPAVPYAELEMRTPLELEALLLLALPLLFELQKFVEEATAPNQKFVRFNQNYPKIYLISS